MHRKGMLVMSEGPPTFCEERGLFILSIPCGGRDLRFGFLPHDFLQAVEESRAISEEFFERRGAVPFRRTG